MNPPVSVFLDFSLPNATTWFYFSWLLAVALFFKFSRLLSVRNWDVVTVFLLVPGLLVIQGTRARPAPAPVHPAVQIAELVGHGGAMVHGAPTAAAWFGNPNPPPALASGGRLWWGYLWLMCGSAYLFLRCLLDLTLVQRPALPPNLNFGGLFWLGGALLACLIAVAFRAPERLPPDPALSTPGIQSTTSTVGPESASLGQLRQQFGSELWLSRAFAVLGHLA